MTNAFQKNRENGEKKWKFFCFGVEFRAKNGGEGRSEGEQRREMRPSADATPTGTPKIRFARFGEPLLRLG